MFDLKKPASYLQHHRSGELDKRANALWDQLANCRLCPHECGVNRFSGKTGRCRSSAELLISHIGPHYGEEPPIRGAKGAGTVFFTGCSFACVFCQNYQISQDLRNSEIHTVESLAEGMLTLQHNGCHNIDLVTPTHFLPHILKALSIACKSGLCIPLVYNTNGFERLETLAMLDGIVDIYLPDAKYADDAMAAKYSRAGKTVASVQTALEEMWRQVGRLKCDENGIAESGLLIRHLVLPNRIAGSREVLEFIAGFLSTSVSLSLMAQYYPTHRASRFPEINRPIKQAEYEEVLEHALALGFTSVYSQAPEAMDYYRPDFSDNIAFKDD